MKHLIKAVTLLIALMGLTLPSAAEDTPLTPPEHIRGPEQTYLTFPEWFLVHSPAEYAIYIKGHNPSDFPYWGHIGQFWSSYGMVYDATKEDYPLNMGYHVMVSVIGTSTTVEYAAKSGYETMVGRLSEITRTHGMTKEDELAAFVAQDYVDFIEHTPWYKYDFLGKLKTLWTDTALTGPDPIRKWERKYALTTEYTIKAAYGWLIGKATAAGYEAPSLETIAVLDRNPAQVADKLPKLKILGSHEGGRMLVSLPRYQPFTTYAIALAHAGVSFEEIAGNRGKIVVSVIARAGIELDLGSTNKLVTQPILTQPGKVRLVLETPVASLSSLLRKLEAEKISIEHIYDF